MSNRGIPLDGDRSAWDAENYPSKHASDLNNNTPIHHVPAGVSVGDILQWDGDKWVLSVLPGGITDRKVLLGTIEGDVSVAASPFEIYNVFGEDRTIEKVFLSVPTGDEPTGDDLVANVATDGVDIFTAGNEPTILDGNATGESTTIEYPTWVSGTALTWEITQVGSTTPGSNLVIHIVHVPVSAGS